ncbi:hypothetical protein P170DRAFT_434731 [Aspergillus steynii IBT 23096]|uniref:Uncharacterized protein n=1 Tax=Aspergillus steynii IBT 23096 TaxID=1392250 RepID=A0A2I2GJF2_9EURO|nr:uncharacterized protein P170DRAFT_434731 [Aspergillus steynii IBT 23096]PLB53009.1 hypothetical protein P170DRAFT_434731 [Aspergillus steynii IBT 23096]
MKRCLCPARLLRPSVSSLNRRVLGASLHSGLRSWRSSPGRRQWSRQYSVSSRPPPFDRRLLENYASAETKKCPVPWQQQSDLEAWMVLLEQYLPPSLRRCSQDADEDTTSATAATTPTQESFARTLELNNLLMNARSFGGLDLLAHLGFRFNNWPAVYHLTNQLLDAADALNEVAVPVRHLSDYSWGRGTGLSLDQLTDQSADSAPRPESLSGSPPVSGLTSLDAFTERPFAHDHSKRIMAEVWQGLGSIVLDAADASPNESKLAMSCVFRILARLHHSGAVADRLYKYVPPTAHQTVFRPPGMHLLSTHIMNVLSDAAWLMHEAEVAAQAAAAGEDSPYLPFKMGIRELGPEIWLEFILWCCVEHGHVKEGVWLVNQMKRRAGDLAWKFESWRPLLQRPELVWKTNIDQEESWRHTPAEERTPSLRKRTTPPPFNGLGKRTVSLEVAAALLDNVPNQVYLGLGFRGISPTMLIDQASVLKFAMASETTGEALLPTNMATNRFVVRVVESRGFNQEVDPEAFEKILRFTPHVVPPWNLDLDPVDEDDLERLRPSQICHESWAMAGLIEYNVRSFSSQKLCGDAINAIEWLQRVIDASKMYRIDEFFAQENSPDSENLPVLNFSKLVSLLPLDTSMPQLSVLTLAELLDLATASRAFTFGEWLLLSDDIDGPPIPLKLYGNQALTPSIIRFATATNNSQVCDSAVQSLSQPLSTNTLRALLNFQIAMRQWDSVAFTLEYLRDFRLKSWGHSNVIALAAEIVRIDHAIQQQQSPDPSERERLEESLTQARSILLRVLHGEFNESQPHLENTFQNRSLYSIHQVFLSIPGALHDVAAAATLQYTPTAHSRIPYIPSAAFHPLLSAVVDTRGSAAGKRLWQQWCLDILSPAGRRRHKGGMTRLYQHSERNPAMGDPHFDSVYFHELQQNAVIPNPNTVRIIAQAAVKEHDDFLQSTDAVEPEQDTDSSPSSKKKTPPATNPAIAILEFCAQRFESLGLRRREVNREVGGLVYRRKKELRKQRKERMEKRSAAQSASTTTDTDAATP